MVPHGNNAYFATPNGGRSVGYNADILITE
jgi:hypothetical protein